MLKLSIARRCHQSMGKLCSVSLLLFSAFFVQSQVVRAETGQDAITAVRNDNFPRAVLIWEQLAKQGKTFANYNLSQLYKQGKGVEQNIVYADSLMKQASQAGLVEAYLKFNTKAVAPAPDIHLSPTAGPDDWVMSLDAKMYTIQLASSTRKTQIEKLFEENELTGNAGYYQYMRDGVMWYALVYGSYKSVGQANEAIAMLPEDLRKWSPWVRNIHEIQALHTAATN